MTAVEWAVLVIAVLLAIGALFLAESGASGIGWALFAIAIILGFGAIKRHFDRIDRVSGRHPSRPGRR